MKYKKTLYEEGLDLREAVINLCFIICEELKIKEILSFLNKIIRKIK